MSTDCWPVGLGCGVGVGPGVEAVVEDVEVVDGPEPELVAVDPDGVPLLVDGAFWELLTAA